jgi:hypothetical protein
MLCIQLILKFLIERRVALRRRAWRRSRPGCACARTGSETVCTLRASVPSESSRLAETLALPRHARAAPLTDAAHELRFGQFQFEIHGTGCRPEVHVPLQRFKAEHLYLDRPRAGRQRTERVVSVHICRRREGLRTLGSGYRGTRNELVSRFDESALSETCGTSSQGEQER